MVAVGERSSGRCANEVHVPSNVQLFPMNCPKKYTLPSMPVVAARSVIQLAGVEPVIQVVPTVSKISYVEDASDEPPMTMIVPLLTPVGMRVAAWFALADVIGTP